MACTKVGTVHFAKTKFLLHAGLGVGALYKFVYKPFQSGKFKKGATGRVRAIVLGGAATLFAVHELKVAKKDAEADKTLCKLVAPLNLLTAKLTGQAAQMKAGNANPATIAATGLGLQSFAGQSGGLGAQIRQIAPPSLGSFAP